MTATQSYTPKSARAAQRPGYWTPTLSAGMVAQIRDITGGIWSPDGRYLYFAMGHNARSDIMRLDLNDKSVTQITSDYPAAPLMMMGQTAGTFDFSLSPDGSQIVYMSETDGKAYLISSEGGLAKRVSLGEGAQSGVTFSPDGKQVAFTTLSEEVFGIGVAGTGGNQWPRLVSDPEFYAFAPRWFKDGKRLIYFAYDKHTTFFYENRLMLADLETGQSTVLFDGLDKDVAYHFMPGNYAPSPDGKYLAYVSEESGWSNIYLMDLVTGKSRCLIGEAAEHHDLQWSPDGSKLAYLTSKNSTLTVHLATLDGKHEALDEGQFVCAGLGWSPDGTRLTYSKQSPSMPPNIWLYDLNQKQAKQLTRYNTGGVAQAGLVEAEVVTWTSPDGTEIEGILLKPEKIQPGKHPLLLYIHGGPMMQYNLRWDPYPQYWVNRGWVVLQPNFRGSTGYGRDFRKALLGTWGVSDMEDNLAGIDYLNAQGLIDPSKVVSWGLSGGGYATMRLLSGWPDRFKAGMALAGLSNLVSFPEQTDKPAAFLLQILLGVRNENLDIYKERSAVNLAHQVKAPLLILEGDVDYRVPSKQGEEMIEALKKAGKTDFERHVYAGEGHGWRKVSSVEDYIERMEKFLTKWVLER
jgi:dipeptidyl aminopeptidase/acylaminoacyl peptidase